MSMYSYKGFEISKDFLGYTGLVIFCIFVLVIGVLFFTGNERNLLKWHDEKLLPVIRDVDTFENQLQHANELETSEYIKKADRLTRRAMELNFPDTKLGMKLQSAFVAYLNSLYGYISSTDRTADMFKDMLKKRKKYQKLYDKFRSKVREKYLD